MISIIQYFNSTHKHSSDAYLLVTAQGHLRAANPAFYKLLPFATSNSEDIARLFTIGASNLLAVLTECRETSTKSVTAHVAGNNLTKVRLYLTKCETETTEELFHIRVELLSSGSKSKATGPLAFNLLPKQEILLKAQAMAQVGSWIIDLRTHEIEWTPELFRIFNLTPSGKGPAFETFINLIHPADKSFFRETIKEAIASGTPYLFDHRIIRGDGTVAYLQSSGEPIVDEQGEVIGLIGMALDITQRKQSEENLKRALSTIEKMMDNSLEVICTMDKHGNFLTLNRACERVWGYQVAEMTGRSYLDFIYPDDIQKSRHIRETFFCGYPVNNYENRYVHKNGQLVNMIWSVNWSEEEQLLFCVARDITDLRQAQTKICASETRFQSMVQHGSDMIGMLSATGEYMYVSDSVTRILGYESSELNGTLAFDKIHPDDLPYILAQFEELQQAGKKLTTSYRFKAKTGDWRWVETTIINHLDNPFIQALVGSSRDITDCKQAEAQLKESAQRYKSLFDNHPDAVFSLNLDGLFETINPQVATITGYATTEIIGSHYQDLIVPEYVDCSVHYFKQARQGSPQTFESAILTRKGAVVYIKVTSIPIIIDNELIGLYGIAKDISERKKAEQERQELVSRLEQKNKSLHQFAYMISHNLRAPVANIIGLTNLLKVKSTEAEFSKTIVQNLALTAQNLDAVIQDLNLILSTRTKLDQLRENIELAAVLDIVKVSIADEILEGHAHLEADFSLAPEVKAIKSYLYSILYNLITNAIKYKSPDRPLQIRLNSFPAGEFTCLTVQDNGLGLDLDKQKDDLFGIYKRFHSHVDGKGLGLHLVKTQIDALGGKVEVESKLDQGTTFKVYFKQ